MDGLVIANRIAERAYLPSSAAPPIISRSHPTQPHDSGPSPARIANIRMGTLWDAIAETHPEEVNTVRATATTLGNTMKYGGGALGIAAGAYQVVGGVESIAHGQVGNGAVDVTVGSANSVAGGAAMVSAGTVVGAAAGIGAVVDGGRDIYQGVKTGNHERTTVGGVKTVAGGIMLAGAATANPIVVGAGAVLYGGALAYQHRDDLAHAVHWLGEHMPDMSAMASVPMY